MRNDSKAKLFAVAALGAVLLFPSDADAARKRLLFGRRSKPTLSTGVNVPAAPQQCRKVNGQIVCDNPPALAATGATTGAPQGNAPYAPGIGSGIPRGMVVPSSPPPTPPQLLVAKKSKAKSEKPTEPQSVQEAISALTAAITASDDAAALRKINEQETIDKAAATVEALAAAQNQEIRLAQIADNAAAQRQLLADQKRQQERQAANAARCAAQDELKQTLEAMNQLLYARRRVQYQDKSLGEPVQVKSVPAVPTPAKPELPDVPAE